MYFIRLAISMLLCACLLLTGAGCTIVGVAAAAMPPPTIEAQYSGFAGQTVAVMAWADSAIRIDWPTLQFDLANAVLNKLKGYSAKNQPLEGAMFPLTPESVGRFQEDHPELEFSPIESTAKKLGVSRLIYVEVEDFSTRADVSGEMYLGKMTATVKVVEAGAGSAEVVYEERDITVTFPPKAPPEGTLRGNDAVMYRGVIEVMSTKLVERFVGYEMPR